MIKKMTLSLCLIVIASGSFAASSDSLFEAANQHYQDQSFEEAIDLYHAILKENKVSAELYYNLGNSYYKAGHLARSILFLERALLLAPNDPDVLFNLKIANLRVVDKIESQPATYAVKLWRDILLLNSESGWGWISVGLIWISFFGILLFIYSRKRYLKMLSLLTATSFFVLAIVAVFVTSSRSNLLTGHKFAVIMTPNTYIKSEPSRESVDLFILHEGAKVKLIEKVEDWNRIVVSDSKIGWMPSGDLEEI